MQENIRKFGGIFPVRYTTRTTNKNVGDTIETLKVPINKSETSYQEAYTTKKKERKKKKKLYQ